MYIAAIAARRNPDAKDPKEAFVKGLRALLAAHPGEVEAELDLALMIMRGFTEPDKKPVAPGSMEAVAILRGLLPRGAGPSGRAPLHHPRVRRFDICQRRVAELREIRPTGAQHSARAPHAGPHLLADRPLERCGKIVCAPRR